MNKSLSLAGPCCCWIILCLKYQIHCGDDDDFLGVFVNGDPYSLWLWERMVLAKSNFIKNVRLKDSQLRELYVRK